MDKYFEEDLKEIAKQLSQPEGERGVKTGEVMNTSNIGMTTNTINALRLMNKDVVLEIGHGNGAHVTYLLTQAEEITYFGLDISETMIAEAKKINEDFITENRVNFMLGDGKSIPYGDTSFDKIFTVNTIYFWKDTAEYLREIKRVLKPEGIFVLCFADKAFMQSLPFTKYGFELYDAERAIALLKNTGFNLLRYESKTEKIKNSAGDLVTRDYHIIACS